jgi:hypothetical protein
MSNCHAPLSAVMMTMVFVMNRPLSASECGAHTERLKFILRIKASTKHASLINVGTTRLIAGRIVRKLGLRLLDDDKKKSR